MKRGVTNFYYRCMVAGCKNDHFAMDMASNPELKGMYLMLRKIVVILEIGVFLEMT